MLGVWTHHVCLSVSETFDLLCCCCYSSNNKPVCPLHPPRGLQEAVRRRPFWQPHLEGFKMWWQRVWETYIYCVCARARVHVCVLWLCQCARGCTVEGIEGDWQTNQAPETLSLLQCLLVRLPPPTLCLHLWLCKPPHNVGALKWQWKLWLIFVKTHSLLPRFRMRVQW